MQYIEYRKTPPSAQDVHWAKKVKQWYHNGSGLTIAFGEAQAHGRTFYLCRITGTGVTLSVNDKDGNAHVVSTGQNGLDFNAAPFCLGDFGFAIGGTIDMIYGFYV